MTVKDLQLIAPNTKWVRLLSGVFKQAVHMSDEVMVNNPNYVKQIDSMIKATDNRVLANHMIADVILNSLPLLHPKWLQLHDFYLHRITGRKAVPPRWYICTKSAATLSAAFSALYVRKYFHSESKHKVEEMVNFIHKEFIQMLNSVEWMDETTRLQALDKAKAITSHIGFPKQLLNDSQIAKIYENLQEFSADQYFKNMLKTSKWLTDFSSQSLTQTRLKGDWRNFAETTVVNAYYSAIENAIIFPAGILRGMFFNYNNPNYLNFGAIGTVIAHEITHAFDDIGKQFDKNGNNKNWWAKTTDDMFKNRTLCLINQYNNYVLPDIQRNLNGINTLGENIADNVGVREAFKAYQAYAKLYPKEKMLPGLKYTPEQLFWITYGNVWCSRTRPEVSKMFIDKETHSPARFRESNEFNEY
ncbi:unnamed protein product [Oppiella nova]|uniref:Uncharacterized protein n=1 Tax=Oppiella nova TaxID=334625 RepID=A0A7R9LYR6_9ACAR|nr:unnamed protein product [Oppiella nova]CAG2168313.1 unnamed protein product [Oppiella nova]